VDTGPASLTFTQRAEDAIAAAPANKAASARLSRALGYAPV
jgi:hypothetical protein